MNATVALPAGSTLGLGASLRSTEYRGQDFVHSTVDRNPREDRTQTLSASVRSRAFILLGFSPRLSIVREGRDTDVQALDYKRNRAELSLVRQF